MLSDNFLSKYDDLEANPSQVNISERMFNCAHVGGES